MKNEQGGISKVVIVAIVVIVIAVVSVVAVIQMKPTEETSPTSAEEPTSEEPTPPPEVALPRSGEWTASTGNIGFTFSFTVSPERTSIARVSYELVGFRYGSNTASGRYAITPYPRWNITDGQFTAGGTNLYHPNLHIVIQGSFDETATHASGTWEISTEETESHTGTWEASAP